MGSWHKPVKEILANAKHYIAIGQTEIFVDENDPDLPWDEVSEIDSGGGYRLNGPTGFRASATRNGIKFSWNVDFESREANGEPVNLFDAGRLRVVMAKMPRSARKTLANFLEEKVLPGVQQVTSEWRERLERQNASLHCVQDLIRYAYQDR